MNINKNFFLTILTLSAATAWAQNTQDPIPQPPQNNSAESMLQILDNTTTQPESAEAPAPIASSDTSSFFTPLSDTPSQENSAIAESTPANVDPNAPVPVNESAELLEPIPEPIPVAEPVTEPVGLSFVPADSIKGGLQPVEETPAPVADSAQSAPKDNDIWDISPADPIAEIPASDTTEQSAQTAASEKHVLDILHGRAYNAAGNEAAAATVGGEVAMPHKMYNRKFAYVEPVDSYGVVSFGEGSTFFLVFDNAKTNMANYSELGLLTLGYASQSFGLSLEAAMGKSWQYIDNDSDGSSTTYKVTSPGTQYGATVSARLSDIDLALTVSYANPDGAAFVSELGEEFESDEWALGGALTVAKSASSSFAWALNLNFLRYKSSISKTTEVTYIDNGSSYKSIHKTVSTDTTTRVEVIPEFNVGGAVLQNSKARVFLGLNTAVPLVAYDRIEGIVSRHNEYGLVLMPNILTEVALGKNVMAFGSVNYRWDAAYYRDSYIENVSVKALASATGSTTAILGMRLEYEFAALEMAFTKQFLQNPFGSFSDHDEIAMSLGAFVNF